MAIVTGNFICDLFEKATNDDPPGYLVAKVNSVSALYTRIIINACKQSLECLKHKTEFLKISSQRYERAFHNLQALQSKYLRKLFLRIHWHTTYSSKVNLTFLFFLFQFESWRLRRMNFMHKVQKKRKRTCHWMLLKNWWHPVMCKSKYPMPVSAWRMKIFDRL